MRLLTKNEQQTLHHRYKQNDLYRQWSPILAMLQRKYDEADAQTLWHQAEQQIVRLRGELSSCETCVLRCSHPKDYNFEIDYSKI